MITIMTICPGAGMSLCALLGCDKTADYCSKNVNRLQAAVERSAVSQEKQNSPVKGKPEAAAKRNKRIS